MSELAAPADPLVRRVDRLQSIRRLDEQISRLIALQRLEVASLTREDTEARVARYVADELALVWHRSPRQARTRLDDALVFADFPAVHAKIADGTWLIDHADAVLDELVGSGLEHAEQVRVLELVLSRDRRRTPWELRVAVRTAVVVLFPEKAAERAKKAERDRDVRMYHDAPGVASLLAYGPAPQVAEMMASLDALTWPPPQGDARTVAQRRFDTLHDLVCGKAQPGQWQALVLVSLATLEGEDELPGEVVGHGPVPAEQARELVVGAELRRVVVDESGALVAVDATVHRPDLAPDPEDVEVPPRAPLVPAWWGPSAFAATLARLRSDPVRSVDLHTDRYAVPARLKRFLEIRDRTCVFPGCPRRADQCDKDHVLPWPRGSTSEGNLVDECEPHHKGKHNYFTVTRLSDGTVRWTLPCGLSFDRPPRPVLDSWPFRDLAGNDDVSDERNRGISRRTRP